MTDRIKVTITEVQPVQVTIRNEAGPQGVQGDTGTTGAAGADGADGVFSEIASQAEAEAGTENTKGMTSLRVRQAVIAWAVLAASVFKGILSGYTEDSGAVTITTGAGAVDMSTTKNVRTVTLTEDSTITITNLTAYKALTLAITQTAGPWTLGLAYGAKTISVTMNGAAGEVLETVEVWCDGTDLFVPTSGGVLWTVGV